MRAKADNLHIVFLHIVFLHIVFFSRHQWPGTDSHMTFSFWLLTIRSDCLHISKSACLTFCT